MQSWEKDFRGLRQGWTDVHCPTAGEDLGLLIRMKEKDEAHYDKRKEKDRTSLPHVSVTVVII